MQRFKMELFILLSYNIEVRESHNMYLLVVCEKFKQEILSEQLQVFKVYVPVHVVYCVKSTYTVMCYHSRIFISVNLNFLLKLYLLFSN